MENLLPALILPLVIALMVWLGLRSRKSAIAGYESDRQRYTATATMTVTDIRQEDVERWEEQEDGTRLEGCTTVHLPTYEYTVDGKTYRYASRQDTCRPVGACVTGYYDPNNPKLIQEDPVRPPYFAGFFFFLIGGAMIFAGVYSILYMF